MVCPLTIASGRGLGSLGGKVHRFGGLRMSQPSLAEGGSRSSAGVWPMIPAQIKSADLWRSILRVHEGAVFSWRLEHKERSDAASNKSTPLKERRLPDYGNV